MRSVPVDACDSLVRKCNAATTDLDDTSSEERSDGSDDGCATTTMASRTLKPRLSMTPQPRLSMAPWLRSSELRDMDELEQELCAPRQRYHNSTNLVHERANASRKANADATKNRIAAAKASAYRAQSRATAAACRASKSSAEKCGVSSDLFRAMIYCEQLDLIANEDADEDTADLCSAFLERLPS